MENHCSIQGALSVGPRQETYDPLRILEYLFVQLAGTNRKSELPGSLKVIAPVERLVNGFHSNLKVMDFIYAVGVDMGKDHFYYCVVNRSGDRIYEASCENNELGISSFTTQLLEQLSVSTLSDLLLCTEHSGIYNDPLIRHWLLQQGKLSVVAGSKIATSLAGDQGWDEKNDLYDARRIAEYCIRFSDKLEPYALKTQTLRQLQLLQRQRDRLILALNMLLVPVQETERFLPCSEQDLLEHHQRKSIEALKQDIKAIDKKLDQVIKQDKNMRQLYQLLKSVDGIGPVIAREILITTEAFTKFKPNEAKKYARYAGVVPKQWQSGKSLNRRSPHSKRANQHIKALLTQGARSLCSSKGEMGQYFRRKRAEGKAYLSVINAMRNKLILRAFAVVRNQVIYQKNLNICLD